MKLDILVPQYKETDDVIKGLFDSIETQQNVDLKNDVRVIIVNDGSDVFLNEELFKRYSFPILYFKEEHRGVSGTRNACFDHSDADYVMFCDADDMFMNACGLYILFREMENSHFETLVSWFIEETRDPLTKLPVYVDHEVDSTFVHGKVHSRKFLLDNNIRWNSSLTIHEDSYFNCLCQKIAEPTKAKYCQTPFYLWRWRDESVCRHDPKYILKTFNNLIDSNTALISEFINRNRIEDAQFYVTMLIYDSYFTMNKKEWINQENKKYRDSTEKRFAKYYKTFSYLYDAIDERVKAQIIMGVKNRMFQEGLLMESVTFDDWIKKIKKL